MIIHILVGPPGSGKSTYATSLPEDFVRVSQDDQGKSGHMQVFDKALSEGKPIVIDRMNFSVQQRDKYISSARKAGYFVKIVEFRVSRYKCLERCAQRTGHPTIQNSHNASQAVNTYFKALELPQRFEYDDYTIIRDNSEGRRPRAIICDLDGTLCNIDHRLIHVKKEGKKDWKAFFDGIGDDVPYEWCDTLLRKFEEYPIILCSGRPDNYRASTTNWLHEYVIPHTSLFMRERNDYRPDTIVKEILYLYEIEPYYTPFFVVDDRQSVVDMWRSHGLTVLQCQDGNF